MTQFTYFSRHAFARARQRTLLSSAEIADILNRQIFVDTGGIPGFNRRHLLFYSARDEAYFVAIQDRHSGTVVTILPLDYHKTLAWEITDAECQKARELCLTAYQTTSAIQATPQYSSSPVVASVFLISVHFMSPDGKPKTKSLLKIPSASYKNDSRKLLLDHNLLNQLDEITASKGISLSSIFALSIRLGGHGTPVVIDLQPECRSLSARPKCVVERSTFQELAQLQ